MHGAVIALGETEAKLCLDMRHEDGSPAASFTLRAAHADARTLKPFAWSLRTRAAAAAQTRPLPEHAAPRSIDITQAPSEATRARALELGAVRIGAAAITPDQCDAFGRLRLEHFPGRISDAVPNLMSAWRRDAAAGGATTPAGAVVEARLVLRRWPRVGDLMEIFTGVAAVGPGKIMRLVHWVCDPFSGVCWASMEAVAVIFDVATRKAITPSADALELMQKRVIAMAV